MLLELSIHYYLNNNFLNICIHQNKFQSIKQQLNKSNQRPHKSDKEIMVWIRRPYLDPDP